MAIGGGHGDREPKRPPSSVRGPGRPGAPFQQPSTCVRLGAPPRGLRCASSWPRDGDVPTQLFFQRGRAALCGLAGPACPCPGVSGCPRQQWLLPSTPRSPPPPSQVSQLSPAPRARDKRQALLSFTFLGVPYVSLCSNCPVPMLLPILGAVSCVWTPPSRVPEAQHGQQVQSRPPYAGLFPPWVSGLAAPRRDCSLSFGQQATAHQLWAWLHTLSPRRILPQ